MDYLVFREPVSAWTHAAWMLLAIPATALLVQRTRGNPGKQISLLVFGLSMILCFAGSALFHAVRLPPAQILAFNRLDRIGIFLLIAGSFTPPAVVLLEGTWKWGVLLCTWTLAAAGSALLLVSRELPLGLATGLYLVMGWSAILSYFKLARILSHRAMVPVFLGGVFYSFGAVLNMVHWPVIWPGFFEAHELFHVFVMAGSLTHFLFMLVSVVPYERQEEEPPLPLESEAEAMAGMLVTSESR